MRDLKNSSDQKALLTAIRRNEAAYTGTVVDLKGEGRKILVMINVGATSTLTAQVTIQESSDNSTFTTLKAFTKSTNVGTEVFDLTPTKRYIRAIFTAATVESGLTYIELGVVAVIYNNRYAPENIA